MAWKIHPEPADEAERAALLEAAEQAIEQQGEQPNWWRSAFEDLGGGPAPEQAWRNAGVVEP